MAQCLLVKEKFALFDGLNQAALHVTLVTLIQMDEAIKWNFGKRPDVCRLRRRARTFAMQDPVRPVTRRLLQGDGGFGLEALYRAREPLGNGTTRYLAFTGDLRLCLAGASNGLGYPFP